MWMVSAIFRGYLSWRAFSKNGIFAQIFTDQYKSRIIIRIKEKFSPKQASPLKMIANIFRTGEGKKQ